MYQNYITGQTTLSLNLDFSIPSDHISNVISIFVDSIPDDLILETTSGTGRAAYHPVIMLKILLFAYSRRVFSGRKIERILEENYSDKNYQLPYSLYDKEQTRKYKKDPSKVNNWDYYVDRSGVRFNFKCYSQRKDRSTGSGRNLKIYEADEFQLTEEQTQLAKTKTGHQRQIHYNPNWQYLKESRNRCWNHVYDNEFEKIWS
ncbi:MAG: transposase [Lactobacillus sp.]|nr:transposase [Lactobacillus sp.]